MNTIHFVGAGSGAPDLITVRGMRLLQEADVVVYAGSLVSPELLQYTGEQAEIFNSAEMYLEQVIEVMTGAFREGRKVVRLHSGDPSLYGAVREQMDALKAQGIPFEVCPGVSSFAASAASLQAEYTLPGVSQTVILTRRAGRTPVPEREGIRELASHGASLVVFLSISMIRELQEELLAAAKSRVDGITQQELYSRYRTRMQEKDIESDLNVLMKAGLIKKLHQNGRIRYIAISRL